MTDFAIITIIVILGIASVIGLGIVKNKSNSFKVLHRKYLLQLAQLGIIIAVISKTANILNPELNPRKILLTGSALIVAIVGFAAQTAISDVICGLLISVSKPFEIGDRIIIDGMDPGIVEDITLRHIVVAIYDGLKIIVPNSQLNTKTLINFSYKNKERNGVHLSFSVSYDTDVQLAMDIIRDCVAESPYTLTVERNGVHEDSGPVYFLKFADSALILETTIFVKKGTSTYTATTDINMRVNEAFQEHGIEIPYNYLNIVDVAKLKEGRAYSNDGNAAKEYRKKTAPERRHFRTNNVKLIGNDSDIIRAKEMAASFAKRQRLETKDAHQLELMTEEAIALIQVLISGGKTYFWVEGSGIDYRIHLSMDAKVGTEEYKKLLSISSSGRNEAITGVAGRIFDAMIKGVKSVDSNDANQSFEWDINSKDISQEELSESILAALASLIKVSVTKEKVEFVVEKTK